MLDYCDIFISYSSNQQGWVLNDLYSNLKNKGFSVWIDKKIAHTNPDWRLEIDNAIKKCCMVLVVMTPEANLSPYVTYEWAYALGLGKPILIMLRQNTDVHERLKTNQTLHFTDQKMNWNDLYLIVEDETNNYKKALESYIPKKDLIRVLKEWFHFDQTYKVFTARLMDHLLHDNNILTPQDIRDIKSKD